MTPELAARFRARHDELVAAGKIGCLASKAAGGIPVLFAKGACLPEAWENSLVALWWDGCEIRTQYDEKDSAGNWLHPPSRDSSMTMIVEDPLAEPYIHKCFPGGLEDLEEYRQEVLDGVKDHWVRDAANPSDQRWEYTYHERMARYRVPGRADAVDQIEAMARNLAESPVTRRAQMVSWKAWEDPGAYDPPCWQSLWGRLARDEAGAAVLNLNMRFRSRDAFKAAFMNDFAFILLGRKLAERVAALRGEPVRLGRFVDQSDSYHVYGSNQAEFEGNFVPQLLTRTFEQRTWRSDEDFVAEAFAEARPVIAEKIRLQDEKYRR